MRSQNAATTGLFCFLGGALVGAGIALLYAPKTGRELRGKMSDVTEDALNKMKEFGTQSQERIRSTFAKGKELAREKVAAFSGGGEKNEPMYH